MPPTPPAQMVEPFEPNGSGAGFTNAITAKFDETITDSFDATGQIVYYAFAAPVTGRYQIKSSLGLSTRFTLYNCNQTQINYYDNEYLVELTAGTIYYLATKAVTSSQTGSYSFSIVTPKTFEGNGGAFNTAVSIPMDENISGEFNVPGKVDYFIFIAPLTGRYQIKSGIGIPTRFTLFNSNQTQINYYDNEYIVELTAGTIYYLVTKSVSSSQTGNYTFTVTTPYTFERKGGSYETAASIDMSGTISGIYNVPGKVDYYIFEASNTGSYKIKSTSGIPTRFSLYNSNRTQINYYDNEYTVNLTEGTVYYLTTKAVSSSQTGEYAFKIESPGAGISDVKTDPAKIIGYYNIVGQRLLKEPASGVYIVEYDNGTAKKFVK